MPINYETHWSDCGKYNEPAYKNIECTCALERLIHKIEHTRAFIDAQGYLDDSEEWKALRAEADALIRRVFAAELQPTPPAVTPDHSPDATKMVALPRAELERILACIMFICHRDARWIDEPMVKEALKILSAAMEGKDA